MADHPQRRKEAAIHSLRGVLVAATAERDRRQGTVWTGNGPEPWWALHERQTMLDAVNQLRGQAGLPPVAMAVIERIDTSAAGHVDWLDKFALRCAAVAVGEDDRA